MISAAKLRAEASRLRDFLPEVSDPATVAAIKDMIDELESWAKEMTNPARYDP
jgi:hypothetical protein